jgi:chromosome segregation ATPase
VERTQSTSPTNDRAQRERLEQVQMELRLAREQLTTARADAAKAEVALRGSLAETDAKKQAAERRLAELKAEKSALSERLAVLTRRLDDKQKEDALLARGAALRDQYVDWNPNDRRHQVTDGLTGKELLRLMIGVVIGLVFLTVILFWRRG